VRASWLAAGIGRLRRIYPQVRREATPLGKGLTQPVHSELMGSISYVLIVLTVPRDFRSES
jgi:hypothetical protein